MTKQISQLSDETKQMADPFKVQIFYQPDRDQLGDVEVIEADLIWDTVIMEGGVPMTVIRHHPKKVVRMLIQVLSHDLKLGEKWHGSHSVLQTRKKMSK